MPNKDRLLCLLQTLQARTDDTARLTTGELLGALEAEGFECSVRTLRRDIRALQDSGYDICTEEAGGQPTRYAWLDREWSAPELQILIDAVSSAQFIPQARSTELAEKLAGMAGPSHREELKPQILVSEHIKARNKNMIYSVQAIRKAIDKGRKIVFRYLEYTPEMEQVPKHAGTGEEAYTVSPYATVWNNDRYYLVGWSDKREAINIWRIDRMEVPKITNRKRVPPPEGFDVRNYTDKVFWMYGGPEEEVTLRCRRSILDQVVDRFGEGLKIRKLDSGTFDVTVPVSVSNTFFAWVFQFTGEMRILAPGYVKEKYAEMLGNAADDALG